MQRVRRCGEKGPSVCSIAVISSDISIFWARVVIARNTGDNRLGSGVKYRPTLHAAKHDVTASGVSLLSGWIPPLAKVQFFALMTPVAHKTRLPDKRRAKVSRYLLRAKVHVGHVRFWQPPELL
jgi:hypothetical protein